METRLFLLTWNNSKMHIRPDDRFLPRECDGVKFSNGLIALSNGAMYTSQSEMEYFLNAYGKYEIVFLDEQKQAVAS